MDLETWKINRRRVRILTMGANMIPTMVDVVRKGETPTQVLLGRDSIVELAILSVRCGWGGTRGAGADTEHFYPDGTIPDGVRRVLFGQALFVGVHRHKNGVLPISGIISAKGHGVEDSMMKLSEERNSGRLGWYSYQTGDSRWPTKTQFYVDAEQPPKSLPSELNHGEWAFETIAAWPAVVKWGAAWGPPPWEREGSDPIGDALKSL